MSIGGISQGVSPFLSTANSLIQDTIAGRNGTDPRSIIDEIANGGPGGLLKYQEKQAEKKIEEQVLKSMGLSDADLGKLSPDKLEQVEEAVAKALEQQIKNTMKNDAAAKAEAQQNQVQGSNGKSLLSDATAAALFELQ